MTDEEKEASELMLEYVNGRMTWLECLEAYAACRVHDYRIRTYEEGL